MLRSAAIAWRNRGRDYLLARGEIRVGRFSGSHKFDPPTQLVALAGKERLPHALHSCARSMSMPTSRNLRLAILRQPADGGVR
jgi:hypothetical protein